MYTINKDGRWGGSIYQGALMKVLTEKWYMILLTVFINTEGADLIGTFISGKRSRHRPEQRMCRRRTKQNQWDNYTNASDICTDSTLGLRNKYKHGCTQYRRAIPVAVLNTAESHCLLQRGNWSEKALCALIMNLQSLHETSCLLIISFGCKLITIIFICKIYSYTKKKKATNDGRLN